MAVLKRYKPTYLCCPDPNPGQRQEVALEEVRKRERPILTLRTGSLPRLEMVRQQWTSFVRSTVVRVSFECVHQESGEEKAVS